MLDVNTVKLQDLLNNLPDATQSKAIISIAIAIHAAKVQALPTSPVESPNEYYNSTILPLITKEVYYHNEQIILDTELAITLSRAMWMIRYYTIYPSNAPYMVLPNPVNNYDLFCRINLVDQYITPEVYTLANVYQSTILNILNILH